jgi:heme/copper-type cytochrome/quinol oxidase subunit 3
MGRRQKGMVSVMVLLLLDLFIIEFFQKLKKGERVKKKKEKSLWINQQQTSTLLSSSVKLHFVKNARSRGNEREKKEGESSKHKWWKEKVFVFR